MTTFAAKASITLSMERFASWTTVQKRQGPNILPPMLPKFTWRSSGKEVGDVDLPKISLFIRIKPGFLVGYSMKLKKSDVALVCKEALKQGIIERFDKTSSRIRPSSKLKYYEKINMSGRENWYKTHFYFIESKIIFIVFTLIITDRNWSYNTVKSYQCHLTTLFGGLLQNTCPRAKQFNYFFLFFTALTSHHWLNGKNVVSWRTC